MLRLKIAVLALFAAGMALAQTESNKGGINGSVVDPQCGGGSKCLADGD